MAEKKNPAKLIPFRNNREAVEEISEAAIRDLKENYKITINDGPVAATIAFVVIEHAFNYLNKVKSVNEDVEIDFANLFSMGITYRDGDGEEEKDGSFVPYMAPGHIAKSTIKSDEESENEE